MSCWASCTGRPISRWGKIWWLGLVGRSLHESECYARSPRTKRKEHWWTDGNVRWRQRVGAMHTSLSSRVAHPNHSGLHTNRTHQSLQNAAACFSRLAASALVTFPCCQQLSRLLSLLVTLVSFSMQSWQYLLMSLHSVDPDSFNSDSYVHAPGHSLRKLLKHWFRRLYLAVWTTATRFCMEWPIMSWGEFSCYRMLQHASSPEPDVVTTLRRCYVNYTGFLFGGEWSSNSPVWCSQALCDQMPIYLADDIHLVSEGNRRSLRSSSDN